MAIIIRYVNTDSTPGGNGTTNLTEGNDRAYASLNEWEPSERTDLWRAAFHRGRQGSSVLLLPVT